MGSAAVVHLLFSLSLSKRSIAGKAKEKDEIVFERSGVGRMEMEVVWRL